MTLHEIKCINVTFLECTQECEDLPVIIMLVGHLLFVIMQNINGEIIIFQKFTIPWTKGW